MSETLLRIAERGDVALLIERLEKVVGPMHAGRGGRNLSQSDLLLDEALWYAKRGEITDAIVRLEREAHPKFYSEQDCQRQYKIAMAEKHARAAQ